MAGRRRGRITIGMGPHAGTGGAESRTPGNTVRLPETGRGMRRVRALRWMYARGTAGGKRMAIRLAKRP